MITPRSFIRAVLHHWALWRANRLLVRHRRALILRRKQLSQQHRATRAIDAKLKATTAEMLRRSLGRVQRG